MYFLLSVYLAKQQRGCWYMQGLKGYYIALNNWLLTDEVKFLFPVRFTRYYLYALRPSFDITSADLPTQPGKKGSLLAGHCHLPLWNDILQSFCILCKLHLLGVQKSSRCRLTNVSVSTDWSRCLTDVFEPQRMQRRVNLHTRSVSLWRSAGPEAFTIAGGHVSAFDGTQNASYKFKVHRYFCQQQDGV